METAIFMSGWIAWSFMCYFAGAMWEYSMAKRHEDTRVDIPVNIAFFLISLTVYITLKVVQYNM